MAGILAVMNKGAQGSSPQLTGRWRIVEMENWDSDVIDLVEPAFIEFGRGNHGQFAFIAVRGWLDCRPIQSNGQPGVEFSWQGDDEGDQVSGRGWAALVDDATIEGHIFFHDGDDSTFQAESYGHAGTGNGQ